MSVQSLSTADPPLARTDAGSGPVLLFLHGWAASRKFWDPVVGALSDRYRCVAVDLPGFGESPRPDAPYTIEWFAETVERFRAALGLDVAAVVGHSMGGLIAARWLCDHAGASARLVLVNAVVCGPRALFLKSKVLLLPLVRILMFWLCKVRWIRRWVAKDFCSVAPLSEDLVDDITRTSYASAIRSVLSLRRTDVTADLARRAPPALVISTDQDRILTPAQRELARQALPAARFETISPCGHCPMIERPQELAHAISSFLDERAK